MPDGSAPTTLIARSHDLHMRAVREATREADFVASTPAVDSFGEIVAQNWDLERYMANPVVLFGHQSCELPVGQCTAIAIGSTGNLECTIKFASAEANPMAEQVWRCVQEKVLRAVSVGFRPNEVRWEMRDGKDVYVLDQNELHEISVVPIPANPEALAKMKAKAFAASAPKTIDITAEPVAPETKTPERISAPTERDMDNEIKDAIDSAHKEAAEARVAEKAATEKATAFERTNATLTAKVSALETDKSALEAQTKTLASERDALKARAEAAEASVIEIEVEALVGKKLTPAEKPEYLELRKSNPDLFARIIAQRSDLVLTTTVVAPDTKSNGAGSTLGTGDFDDVITEVEKLSA